MTLSKEELQRCGRCALRGTTCVCPSLRVVQNTLPITVIRHQKELGRGSNSARILEASLKNISVIDHGARFQGPTLLSPTLLDGATLVFPLFYDPDPMNPPTAFDPSTTPKNLIILDGSWKQTSRMLKKIDGLTQLPRLEILPLSPPLPRIRKPYFKDGMCTMEAAISAFKPFFPTSDIEILIHNYLAWIDQVRKNSGIRAPLKAGQCFKEARIEQEHATVTPKEDKP